MAKTSNTINTRSLYDRKEEITVGGIKYTVEERLAENGESDNSQITDNVMDTIAKVLYENMKLFFSTEEGRKEYAEWKTQQASYSEAIKTEKNVHNKNQGEE